MKKYNCHLFRLEIEFNEKDFKKKEFLEDIGAVGTRSKGYALLFGSKTSKNEQHAHLSIFFDKKESSLRLFYHQLKEEINDQREPYMENCAQWISSFFKKFVFNCEVRSIFEYQTNKHEPVVSLLAPVNLSSEMLKGALISGFAVTFPEKAEIDRATVEIVDDNIGVVLFAAKEINLTELDFYNEIEQLSRYAQRLIRKKEGKNESLI